MVEQSFDRVGRHYWQPNLQLEFSGYRGCRSEARESRLGIDHEWTGFLNSIAQSRAVSADWRAHGRWRYGGLVELAGLGPTRRGPRLRFTLSSGPLPSGV